MAQSDTSAGDVAPAPKTGSAIGSLIYDPKVRGIFFQVALLLSIFLFFYWIVQNTIDNLSSLDKRSGFGFLADLANFQILTSLGTWAVSFKPGASTYLDVFWIGLINTLAVSITGLIGCTVIGFVVGVFRLSSNIVLRSFGTAFVEILRNIPILLQLFFWYFFVLRALPDKRDDPILLPFGAQLDKSGLWSAYPLPQDGFSIVFGVFVLAVLFWVGLSYWAQARQTRTGLQFPTFWVGLGVTIVLPLIVFYALGAPLDWEEPVRGRFGFKNGVGMVIKPEMMALWAGLTFYTAAYVAETVRAGILAVNKGQTEAANALGLRAQPTLNLIVIPQAMRVIIPPLTSEYLNLIKNSTLALAVAYPDIVSVFAGTALSVIGQEVEMVFTVMALFLILSLIVSFVMNWYNKRIALTER